MPQEQQMRSNQGRLAAYSQVANLETDPIQRIVLLYNGAIKFLRMAASDIEASDRVAKAEHTNRAMNIIVYLQSILDMEQGKDVAQVLDSLYNHVQALVLKANIALDAQMMRRAADLLAPVCDAWSTNARIAKGDLKHTVKKDAGMAPNSIHPPLGQSAARVSAK